MDCKNKNHCDGKIDLSKVFCIKVGYYSFEETHPCCKCGLLHTRDGLAFLSDDKHAFLRKTFFTRREVVSFR